jgi:hypothetical protein
MDTLPNNQNTIMRQELAKTQADVTAAKREVAQVGNKVRSVTFGVARYDFLDTARSLARVGHFSTAY